MNASEFRDLVILPGQLLLPRIASPESAVLLLAIAGQESSLEQRLQLPVAYARGFFQCESGGAVLAVVEDARTRPELERICATLAITPFGRYTIFERIAWCDPLAYCVARLALWLNPAPLPAIGDQAAAWQYYVETWHPGAPRPERWPGVYAAARDAMITLGRSAAALDKK